MKEFTPMLVTTLKGYKGGQLVKDIVAGIIVAIIALPLSIALAIASGVGPEEGLYTAIIAGALISIFGGSKVQIAGPTAAFATIVAGVVAANGMEGLMLATVMAGIFLVLMGIFKFGSLIKFIPYTITTGFTAGIAVTILIGQLKDFFGVNFGGASPIEAPEKVAVFFENISTLNWWAVLVGVVSLLILILWPKISKKIPASLIAVIVGAVMVALLPESTGVQTIKTTFGELSSKFPSLNLPKMDLKLIRTVLPDAFTIAVLAAIESLLSCVVADGMIGSKHRSNMELIAQGIGNMIIPLMGGVPATAAIARTSVAVKNGGQTRITSIMQSVFLIICMFALPSVIAVVPYAVLAGILFVTAWKMNEWEAIRKYFSKKMWDAILMFLVTMVATVLLDLTYAIIIGVGLSFILMILNTKIEIDYSEVTEHNEDADKKVLLVYSTGSLFFANAGELEKLVKKNTNDNEKIVFVFRGITYLDVSSIDVLTELVEELRESGKEVVFTGVRERIMHQMRRSGFTEMVGEDNFYHSLDKLLLSGDGSAKYRSKY